MKKIIVVAVLLAGLALIPFVGNKVVKQTIENRLHTLSQYGLEARLLKEKKSYLNTQLHYSVTVSDEQKFLEYLQHYSSQQLPPYTKSLLDGVEFGVKIAYSNIPFSEKIAIDLYPVKLSESSMRELQAQNEELAKFAQELLDKRALQYHIDYDIVSAEFRGYMKDLSQTLKLDRNESMHVEFSGVRASGKGMLLAPDTLQSHVEHFTLKIEDTNSSMEVIFEKLNTMTTFESETTYVTTMNVANMKIDAKQTVAVGDATKNADVAIVLKQLATELSSDTQANSAQLFGKMHFGSLQIDADSKHYIFKGFNYDFSLEELAKASYIKLHNIIKKASSSSQLTPKQENMIEEEVVKILANGLHAKIADLSLQELSLPSSKNVPGFSAMMDLRIHKDPTLLQRYKKDPDALVKNIQIDATLRLSKPFYALLNDVYPVELMFGQYKQEQNDRVVFVITFKEGVTKINQKVLR